MNGLQSPIANLLGRICAELVFGYNRHAGWDGENCCWNEDELVGLDALIRSQKAAGRGGDLECVIELEVLRELTRTHDTAAS